ncbi:MAG: AbrB family transcriptional regulator, partial [Rhodovibrionaceae bacterium]
MPIYRHYDLRHHIVNCLADSEAGGVRAGNPLLRNFAVSLGLTLIVGGAGGFLVDSLGLPGGWIIGSLAAAYIASFFKVPIAVPPQLRSLAMGFVGMTVGSAIDREMLGAAGNLPWSLLAMFGVMALMGGLTYALHRKLWGASGATAISCAWPGNVLLAFASAKALNADMDRVTVVQLVRVLILMAAMPLAIGSFHS